MMNHPNNQKFHTGKLLLLLPLIGALFMSFSIKIENLDLRKELAEILPILNIPKSEIINRENRFSIEDLQKLPATKSQDTIAAKVGPVFTIVENMPYPSTGDIGSYLDVIHSNLIYPEKAKQNKTTGKVYVQFIVQKDGTLREVKAVKGISPECDAEAVKVIKNGPLWNAGEQRGTKVNVRMILPIPFGVSLKTRQDNKIRMITGEVITEQGTSIPGASVAVVGSQTGTYTDPDGKFDINLKTSHRDQFELVVSARGFSTKIIAITKEDNYRIILPSRYKHVLPTSYVPLSDSLSTDDNENQLVILDGKEITYEQMKKMDANPDVRIEQVSVLKGASGIKKYGEKAKNGVIIITTKE